MEPEQEEEPITGLEIMVNWLILFLAGGLIYGLWSMV